MSLNKLKIAFDPVIAWDYQLFRDFIIDLISKTDQFEVYLVTISTDTDFINYVIDESGIDSGNVHQVANNSAVVARLTTLKALIFFAEDNVLVNFVNSTIPIQLNTNNVTGCQALVLNNIMDPYKVQMKYITYFQFWWTQIDKQYA